MLLIQQEDRGPEELHQPARPAVSTWSAAASLELDSAA
eukprot:COSAG04_NODE_32914_length_191_cov_56.000000_1_plen_37_part_10